ncbi:ABC transporter ATP-binding protein [Halostella litorea]|uniref:ABC transporter ATP-binding protein n=1 Tax=Halostella litorea TaxID=2528831 RepID=UPI001091C2F0|nr:ABC transporter ATP-binding protein [Halostella litorea]
MTVVRITGLSKQFDSVTALRDISLSVQPGEVFALVGPNGAGKTTLIDVLASYTRPGDGTVRVLGMDPQNEVDDVHHDIGILPQGLDALDGLTARQHVEYAIDAKGADDDPARLLERVGLDGNGSQYVDDFSRGMTQRVALAMALVGEPELLLLDEPFAGIDPNGRRRFQSIIREEANAGTGVLLSSHGLRLIEEGSDRIGVLVDGTLRATGTPNELVSAAPVETVLTVETTVSAAEAERVATLDAVTGVGRREDTVVVRTRGDVRTQVQKMLGTDRVRSVDPTLDDVFAYYTVDTEPDRR